MAEDKRLDTKRVILTSEGEKIDNVFKKAVNNALKRHKEAGNSVAVWRNGKVVLLSPDQIKAYCPHIQQK